MIKFNKILEVLEMNEIEINGVKYVAKLCNIY